MSKTFNRPIRVLVAKVGLDGHDRGAKVIATALRDAGMEVIYTGLRQTPEILSGAHMTVFPKIIEIMKAKQLENVLVTGGGIIPDPDVKQLQELGVGQLFPPGTTMQSITEYIRNWVRENRNF
jgi:methylmalonyl-CoA mutase C-terminal domain/subunit